MELLWILKIWLYFIACCKCITQYLIFLKNRFQGSVEWFRLEKLRNVYLFFLDCFGINIFLQTVIESQIYKEERGWETFSDICLLLFFQLFLISCLSCHQWEQSCWGSSPMPSWETVWLLNTWYCISSLQCEYLRVCWEFMYLSLKSPSVGFFTSLQINGRNNLNNT